MFTLRFESDILVSGGADVVWMTETPSYRVEHRGEIRQIGIPNEHGVDVYHILGSGEGCYDRCFVMNSQGRTVAKFEAPKRKEANG